MIKSIIFDLYGTLLRLPHDSQPYLRIARGCLDTRQEVRSAILTALTTKNPTLQEFTNRFDLGRAVDYSELEQQQTADIAAVELFNDVLPTLQQLKSLGIKLTTISNLATPYKRPFFTYGLDQWIDRPVFSCDCGLVKPDPEIYKLALKQNGFNAEETLMVGDGVKTDVEGPSAIGIHGLLVDRCGRGLPGKRVVPSLNDIFQYL